MSAWMRVAIIARRAGRTRYSRSQLPPQALRLRKYAYIVFHNPLFQPAISRQ